jgi:hypothetical protein
VLGVTPEAGMHLVQEAPMLLLLPTSTTASAWAALQRAASMRAEWKEQVGAWTVPTLARCVPLSCQ